MTSAGEASFPKRILQVACAITWCFLAAGPVFGFAALKPVLIDEHVYIERCNFNISDSSVACVDQDLALNFLFTVACIVTNVSALPVGWLLDAYGPKVSGILGGIIIFIGSLFFRLGGLIRLFDGYLIGYTLIALGGPFVFISCFQLANSFPKNSGLVLALLTGAFDSSSALFLVYRLIYNNIHRITLEKFFTCYFIVPIFIIVCQLTIMPSESYKTVSTLAKIAETAIDESGRPLNRDLLSPEDRESVELDNDTSVPQVTVSETTGLLMRRASDYRRSSMSSRFSRVSRSSMRSLYEEDAENRLLQSTGGVFGVMQEKSIHDQLKSSWFVLMTLFTTIQMLRINYFVATVKSQVKYLYNDEQLATQINHFFDIALPLGGFAAIPFIGIILDNLKILTTLTILLCVSLFIGIMGLLSWMPGTYIGIIFMVIYRPFYYTAVSDYCAKVFGFNTFGMVYGSIISFSGICNILQQVMDNVTHNVFHMNPIPINSISTFLTFVFGFFLCKFVRTEQMDAERKNLELEAQEATTRQMPK